MLYFEIDNKMSEKNLEEQQILDCMSEILQQPDRVDRTGVGTKSLFGREMRFDIREKFPLMTTRRLSLRMIFEELLWILRGQTDTKILDAKKVPVWNPNTTREFLDSQGLTDNREGDLGESYGFLMRHFGAKYDGCDKDYTGQGFDQLQNVIHLLKTNPTSRRIMMVLWNPSTLHNQALPPCLYNFQFYVREGKYLSCKATQRSSDVSLAGGWNVAYIALLTYVLAEYCDLIPDQLIWSVGDIHLYLNQLDGVKEQVKRTPHPYPTLRIINKPENLLDLEWENIKLDDYNPYKRIKLEMNA